MAGIETPQSISDFPIAIVKSMVGLATSGFGVVVALAWNQVIQNVVTQYIDPYLGKGGGIVSLFIYAILMTILAVVVTMQLTGLQRRLEDVHIKLTQKEVTTLTRRTKARK
jgi:uncharacterized membrane protein (DUF106 family)